MLRILASSNYAHIAKLKKDQVDALKVRAGTNGVLQVVAVQEGQQVAPGVNIARVADPASLKGRTEGC